MRARMALLVSGFIVEIREVVLGDKPAKLVEASVEGMCQCGFPAEHLSSVCNARRCAY
jgi:hypothetical protein